MKQSVSRIAHGLSGYTNLERFGDTQVLRNASLKESVFRDCDHSPYLHLWGIAMHPPFWLPFVLSSISLGEAVNLSLKYLFFFPKTW